jgi:hypothetical protein
MPGDVQFDPRMADGDLVRRGGRWYVAWYFDADECVSVANTMPPDDNWVTDLRDAAECLRTLEGA